jgi:hypothetical protein
MGNDIQSTAVAEKTSGGLAPRATWRDLVDHPWLLLLTLFFVTAAVGLPLLWISRGFSTFWKIVLTFAVLAWTALVFWIFYLIMAWCIPIIWESLRQIV